jgi:hypothetical protein
MARFSIGEAVGEGFGLIKRRPFSVFVWGLLTILPAAAAMGVMLPAMEEFTGSVVRTAAEGEAASGAASNTMMAEMMQMQAVMAPLNALRFVLGVVVYTAIIRAVVRPRESSFFSLRLSMDEVRVFVVALALIIGLIIGGVLLGLLGGAIGAGLWSVVGAARGLAIAALVIAGIILALLLGGRLSLLVPATVRFRTFAFVEGWNLGKGKSWALVGVMLLLFLIVIGIEIVVGGVLAGVMFAVLGNGGFDPVALAEGANPFEEMSGLATANWPWLAAALVVGAMLYGMMTAILTAPFASVVRQLSDDAPAAH